jgi:protein lifeguard
MSAEVLDSQLKDNTHEIPLEGDNISLDAENSVSSAKPISYSAKTALPVLEHPPVSNQYRIPEPVPLGVPAYPPPPYVNPERPLYPGEAPPAYPGKFALPPPYNNHTPDAFKYNLPPAGNPPVNNYGYSQPAEIGLQANIRGNNPDADPVFFHGLQSNVNNAIDRRGFIKKVYTLLCIQLIWTAVVTGIVVGVPTLAHGIKQTTGAVLAAMLICLIIAIAVMFFKKIARQYPYNYIALFSFSFFESYVVAFVCAFYNPYIVLCAAIITMVVTFALTAYACQTRKDFTTCGGILVSLFTSFVMFGFFMIFFHYMYLQLIFCEIAIIFYCFFIVYDTQMVAGGRYQEISYDDYVIGALMLYVDIIGLFLYVLSFLGGKR